MWVAPRRGSTCACKLTAVPQPMAVTPSESGTCLEARICRVQRKVVSGVQLHKAWVGQVHFVARGRACRGRGHHSCIYALLCKVA